MWSLPSRNLQPYLGDKYNIYNQRNSRAVYKLRTELSAIGNGYAGTPDFIALCVYCVFKVCATLHRVSPSAPFFQQPLFIHVSVSYFGNSCNISNFFIIDIFVRVICDK